MYSLMLALSLFHYKIGRKMYTNLCYSEEYLLYHASTDEKVGRI